MLAFAIGGQGVGGVATRFMLPMVALAVPYAAQVLDGLCLAARVRPLGDRTGAGRRRPRSG